MKMNKKKRRRNPLKFLFYGDNMFDNIIMFCLIPILLIGMGVAIGLLLDINKLKYKRGKRHAN